MKVGDVIIDNGEQDQERKGNIYKIVRIENQELSDNKWIRKDLNEINQINPDDLVILCAYAKETTSSSANYIYVPLTNAKGTSG